VVTIVEDIKRYEGLNCIMGKLRSSTISVSHTGKVYDLSYEYPPSLICPPGGVINNPEETSQPLL